MASNYAHTQTDKLLQELEKKISKVYGQARKELSKTIEEYFEAFVARDLEQAKALEQGLITEQEYTQWRLTQMARGEKYKDLQNKIAERYTEANETAMAYVNDATPGIYSLNRNYAAYTIEKSGADVAFNLWDEQTVKRLIVESPNLMPNYPEERAVRRGIDLAYGKQQITASIQSAILQGKSVDGIAKDLQNRIPTMNQESAVRAARTAVTNAENAGRQDTYEEAEDMGIEMTKVWVATLDDRTREEHQDADGQEVPIDEPFIVGGEELMFPGDDSGSGWNVYNCRCTMITKIKNMDMKADRWARNPETGEREKVTDMTYKEWMASHGN